ncbi:MAG: hypothetical protein ACYC0Q_11450 [Eubacteriales bacterium]
MMRSDRVLAVLSGFEPTKTPGVGTFYDFVDRIWLEDDDVQIQSRKRLRKPFRKTSKRLKAGEKLPVKHPGIVDKLRRQFGFKSKEKFFGFFSNILGTERQFHASYFESIFEMDEQYKSFETFPCPFPI